MKRLTIIGANSAIAKNTIPLIKDQYQLTLISRSETNYQDLSHIKQILLSSDYIVYCIGITNGHADEIQSINIDLFDRLSSYFNKKTKIVIISSAAVIYNDNAYARSKKYIEDKVRNLGFKYISLRPSVMYGPHDTKNLVNISKFIKVLPLVPVIASNHKIQPVYIADIARLIENILTHDLFTNKEYTISGPDQIEIGQVFKLIARKLNAKRLFIKIPLAPIQRMIKLITLFVPPRAVMAYQILNMKSHPPFDSSEAVNDLDFKQTSFQEGLLEY